MIVAVIISLITFALMVVGILFFPKIKISKSFQPDSYWVIALLGFFALLISGSSNVGVIAKKLTENTAVNPLKILVLFLSMTFLSVYLDELGFFRCFANLTLSKAKGGQLKLFTLLYITVSILTVFTSNDVIILSFTPFILYFCRSAKINPLPFLLAEFTGANTWSMALIIGNPTNIYLATASGIDFISYFQVMIIPTIVGGLTGFLFLYLMFRKQLTASIEKVDNVVYRIADKHSFIVGASVLGACTIALAISSYIELEMWIISFASVILLNFSILLISIIKKRKPTELKRVYLRLPFQLIPFVLAMFCIIITLQTHGVSSYVAEFLGTKYTVFVYGATSFLTANVLNNIPMSVIYTSITQALSTSIRLPAVFGAIVGSNLGALFTPIGALAGIMWSSILNKHGQKSDFKSFLKMGIFVALPSLLTTLLTLHIVFII